MNSTPSPAANDFTPLQNFLEHASSEIACHHPVCELSGRCCKFTEYGHTLFLSRWEAELLLQDGLPPNSKISPDNCPFQINNLCTAREKRPLGCRSYYCDPNYQNQMPDTTESLIRELKQLHISHQKNWDYRPLHHFLKEHQSQIPTPDSPPK